MSYLRHLYINNLFEFNMLQGYRVKIHLLLEISMNPLLQWRNFLEKLFFSCFIGNHFLFVDPTTCNNPRCHRSIEKSYPSWSFEVNPRNCIVLNIFELSIKFKFNGHERRERRYEQLLRTICVLAETKTTTLMSDI